MNVSTVASQAIILKEQSSRNELGLDSIKQQADSQQKIASLLDKQAVQVTPKSETQSGFSTYA